MIINDLKKLSLLSLLAVTFSLTSCKEDDPLPPIDGYNSADEVAKTDLVAYWPLNGNGAESISNTNPNKSVGNSFEDGIKGQGLKLTAGYLSYPEIAALAAINGSITISSWAKISNTKTSAGANSTISPIISLTNPVEQMGNVSIFGNTHGLSSSDSIQMKAEYKIKGLDGNVFGGDALTYTKMESWQIDENANGASPQHAAFANKIGGKWAQVVYRFFIQDGKTYNQIFVNGVKISNPPFEKRSDMAIPFNQFTPSYPVLGALKTVVEGTNADVWNAALTGSIDEVRIFKKSLSDTEISALYKLELAGR